MRNLKKILALVLALVMTMSVMATAAFTDAATIDTSYDEAAEVLAGLKVFVGRPDGSFDPKANITRQEVAAIVYRIVTGDVDNKSINLYVEGADFDDVKATDWAAGYIGYCNNAGFIAGYGNGQFGPTDNVTGMQAAAMILRAVGYDAQDEFTGADWDKYVAKYAQQLGLFKNLKADVNLNKPVSREVVAEILFQAIQADMVEWTPAFDYQPVTFLGAGTQSLGEKTFGLYRTPATGSVTVDNWGRPGHVWYASKVGTKAIATIVDDYLYATNVAVSQCDIAHAVGQTATKTYDVYDNAAVKTGTQAIDPLATTAKVGAQGQILEVYKDRIVLIDTLLAKVESVADATYDANGHLKTNSQIVLDIYDTATARDNVVVTNGKTNYPYTAGQYVLVNAHLNNDAVIVNYLGQAEYLEVKQVAETITGAQTVIWWNAGQHTVNGTTYNDAARFHLNNVGMTETDNRTWFFDQFGNLIGNVVIATNYSYAAIKNMWWAGDAATGLGSAKATLVYMDGTENVVTVSGIKLDGAAATINYAVPAYAAANDTYDMKYVAGTTTAAGALYVASYQPTNTGADANGVITYARATGDMGNLFRVATKADGTVLLDEVALQVTAPVLAKYAYITNDLKVNSNTQFLVYNTTTKAFSAFADFNNMPSFSTAPVIDYVKGADGYAKYVYIIGTPDTATTYNFVMPQSINYSAELKTAGGINYYVVTIVNIDGTQTTLKVKTADKAAVLDVLAASVNLNDLFYVTFTGEYATGVIKVTGIGNNYTGMAAGQRISLLSDNGLAANAAGAQVVTRTGNDLALTGGYHFNVTEATEIVGTLPEGRQLVKDVYVLSNAKDNTAIKIWVVAGTAASVTAPTAPYIATAAIAKVAAPVKGALVADYAAPAVTGVSSSDLNFHGTVTANVEWYVLSGGNYVKYTGEAFVAGTYQAVVNLVVTNVTGEAYAITSASAITYDGAASAAAFTVQPITVA